MKEGPVRQFYIQVHPEQVAFAWSRSRFALLVVVSRCHFSSALLCRVCGEEEELGQWS